MVFDGKRVLVLGAARSGVAAAKVLHSKGAVVVVNDTADDVKLKGDAEELATIGAELVSGGHPLSLLDRGFDLIVKNPGIPPSIPFLAEARFRQIPVISEIELAYQVSRGKMVTITGSNGKTTTTTWVGEMLKQDYDKVVVAGNIGIPLSIEAANCDPDTWLVVELSSFQLHDIIDFRSEVAVVLNVTPAHLDWHGDFASYLAAKTNAVKNQRHDDIAVLSADNEYTMAMAKNAPGLVYLFSRKGEVEQGAFLKGEEIWIRLAGSEYALLSYKELGVGYGHNIENAMAASLVALASGVKPDSVRSALREFKGLPHRFQVVARIEGRTFINDSKATNPGASEIALTLPGEPIILIAGGLERNIDLAEFAGHISKYCHYVVLIGQTAQRLANDLNAAGFSNYVIAANMEEAVPLAYKHSRSGDTILLSTGCASWDMYSNYDVRGDDFIEQVGKLIINN